jgi:hypothetical protein
MGVYLHLACYVLCTFGFVGAPGGLVWSGVRGGGGEREYGGTRVGKKAYDRRNGDWGVAIRVQTN